MRACWSILLGAALIAIPDPAVAQSDLPVLVVRTDDLSFPAALRHPVIGGVARAGGIGLLAGDRLRDPVRLDPGPVGNIQLTELAPTLSSSRDDEVLVIVAGSVSNEPDWLALATGPPDQILEGAGPPGGLTSDTTARDGIVAGDDVTPTILDFLSQPVPDDQPGSVVEVEGDAPVDLYERAVDYRRVALPVGLAVLALGIGALVVGLAVLLLGIRSTVVRGTVAVLGLLSVTLLVALVPASVFPSIEPVAVIPGLLLVGVLLLVAALVAGRGDPTRAVTVVAAAGLVILVVDGILGWPSEVTPLLGGGALLGVRFTGLGNSAAGIVLAGAVLWATRLNPWPGVGVIAGGALFAGLDRKSVV